MSKEKTKKEIIEAYIFLRYNNMSIPSDTLEFMKDSSLKALDKGNGTKAENLLADIRNKLSPASHLICLVVDYFSGVRTSVEFEILHEHIKQAIPKAEESIEYVRKLNL